MSKVRDSAGTTPARWQPAEPPRERGPQPTASQPSQPRRQVDLFEPSGAGRGATALGRTPTPQPPQPTQVGTAGSPIRTTGTTATYQAGPPQRPPIRHDNGFRQNPADPNDPNPIPTVSPTAGDYLKLAEWNLKLEALKRVQGIPGVPHNDIPDGLAAYEHFLRGGGRDRTFSYERFVSQDPAGQTTLNNATRDTQLAAEAYYNQLVAADPSLAGKPITFQITGSAIGVGGRNPQFPYPQTENWQKAIGAHQIWTSATVTVQPPATPGGKPQFSMRMNLNAEDRYNFNPGAQDIATGTPDAENGRFEITGLAHQYTNYATLQRDVSWTQGSPQNATSRPVGGR